MNRKGIVLAGGYGSRLHPATRVISKQLLPVYDKPMIYYPMSVLMLAGIRDILIVAQPTELPRFEALLGDGGNLGLRLSYAPQPEPRGLPDAFLVGRRFIADDPVALALGDNVLFGTGLPRLLERQAAANRSGAVVFSYPVSDPSRFGIVEFDHAGAPRRLVEKPLHTRSNQALLGLYFLDNSCVERAAELAPSPRGELEIIDLLNSYLADGCLSVQQLGRGIAWLDAGTADALLEAGNFVATIERRQGMKIACLEEIAWRQGWIGDQQLSALAAALSGNGYGNYLMGLLEPVGDRNDHRLTLSAAE
ncbi:MAG: glucose-1-phosphate thymidylyltransferase RfbA [Alphaproteobacteria bacterium]|nr:glucose-1-phosphate thymidylyltransferase RfbA [Alphaproteobacteria bacterium]